MLTCTRVNPFVSSLDEPHPLAQSFSRGSGEPAGGEEDGGGGDAKPSPSSHQKAKDTTLSRFLPTSRRLVQFSNGRVAPEGARIVYIDGAFDVFHPGHVKVLEAAKQEGDFLLVGLHTDEEVQSRRGPHLPIMNLHERSLSVLACKVSWGLGLGRLGGPTAASPAQPGSVTNSLSISDSSCFSLLLSSSLSSTWTRSSSGRPPSSRRTSLLLLTYRWS